MTFAFTCIDDQNDIDYCINNNEKPILILIFKHLQQGIWLM